MRCGFKLVDVGSESGGMQDLVKYVCQRNQDDDKRPHNGDNGNDST